VSANADRLLAEAIGEIEGDVPLSAVISKAQRIARDRQDWENLYWLAMEMRSIGDTGARDRVIGELAPFLGPDLMEQIKIREGEAYITERSVPGHDDERVLAAGVGEIEEQIAFFEQERLSADNDPNQAVSLADREDRRMARDTLGFGITQRRQVLSRIRARVRDYLNRTEAELVVASSVSAIFEENRAFVETQLAQLAPNVLEHLATAARRIGEGRTAELSQAMTSCRRALKSFADVVYPATDEMAKGVDGQERKMTDDHYISRLLQHAFERMQSSRSHELLETQIEGLGERFTAVNNASHKGVHADINDFEARQCLIQTYLTIGDFLKLTDTDEGSAAQPARDPEPQ
jgi:hypothetical protein